MTEEKLKEEECKHEFNVDAACGKCGTILWNVPIRYKKLSESAKRRWGKCRYTENLENKCVFGVHT